MDLPALCYEGCANPPQPEIWINYFLRMMELHAKKAVELATVSKRVQAEAFARNETAKSWRAASAESEALSYRLDGGASRAFIQLFENPSFADSRVQRDFYAASTRFWLKPQRTQRTQRGTALGCDLCVLCGFILMAEDFALNRERDVLDFQKYFGPTACFIEP